MNNNDLMMALSQNIRTLNDRIKNLGNLSSQLDTLTKQQHIANELKKVELGLMVGTITKEQAREILSKLGPDTIDKGYDDSPFSNLEGRRMY